jgi:hypothetical protein
VSCPCCDERMHLMRTAPANFAPKTFECKFCRLAVTADQVLQFPELLWAQPKKKVRAKY